MTTEAPATIGVKYIGSKAALLTDILAVVEGNTPTDAPRTIIDVFAGTTRVGQAFRARGWQVQSSDLSWASEAYAHAFLLRTADSAPRIPTLLAELRAIAPSSGWITTNYAEAPAVADPTTRICMWKRANGERADAIRDTIATWESTGYINHHEAMILVACLIFALDRVDSSVGVQQAYLKKWATRALNDLDLVDIPIIAGCPGTHTVGDALTIPYNAATVAYVDPPYSPHSYATYYHIWDSITRWDKPATALKTNRRADRVSGSATFDDAMISPWNSRRTAATAFMTLIERLPVPYVCVSYNDESLVPLATLESLLRTRWKITVHSIAYRRNVMCKIGNAATTAGPKKEDNTEVLIWIDKTSGP